MLNMNIFPVYKNIETQRDISRFGGNSPLVLGEYYVHSEPMLGEGINLYEIEGINIKPIPHL